MAHGNIHSFETSYTGFIYNINGLDQDIKRFKRMYRTNVELASQKTIIDEKGNKVTDAKGNEVKGYLFIDSLVPSLKMNPDNSVKFNIAGYYVDDKNDPDYKKWKPIVLNGYQVVTRLKHRNRSARLKAKAKWMKFVTFRM